MNQKIVSIPYRQARNGDIYPKQRLLHYNVSIPYRQARNYAQKGYILGIVRFQFLIGRLAIINLTCCQKQSRCVSIPYRQARNPQQYFYFRKDLQCFNSLQVGSQSLWENETLSQSLVSIPYRQARNVGEPRLVASLIKFQFLIGRLAILIWYGGKFYMAKFQFLIGRLAISKGNTCIWDRQGFQFLIGRLAITDFPERYTTYHLFQFLIGRLAMLSSSVGFVLLELVSIPYRQARNRIFLNP